MKPAQYPDLKQLITKLEKRHKERQAARALMVASVLLGALVLAAPLYSSDKKTVAVTPTAPPIVEAPDAFADVRLYGKSAIVYDLVTGESLYERHSRAQLPLASLTKLITAYAGATTLTPTAAITITDSALAAEGDSGLVAGEVFSFTDAAKLALVGSSNDAAEAVAEAAAGASASTRRSLMAGAAEALGLTQTYAVNGTGLDVNTTLSGGYGSAYDIARLAGALVQKAPEIAHATTRPSVTVRSSAGVLHTLPNTNHDVTQVPNLLLSKTGFTDLAGGNLAVVYDAGMNHPVAIVVLGSTKEGRFADVSKLMKLTGKHFAGMPATP
mgnify:CR=1 FL=1|jgi:serine-type D-Ala-D-Ala carboxypeptidase (penicillin-binding protein 5/6)|tara:strand:- start:120990 stop:121970 length:981 start_codon:yes stop_codon:yes gene_type:complete